MTLKTLKELERKDGARYGMCSYCIDVAKQEAIKWLKDDSENVSSWKANFMEFHNITEEDLKNDKI